MSILLLLATLICVLLFWRERRARITVERERDRLKRLSGFDCHYIDVINKLAKTGGLTPAGKLRIALPEFFPGLNVTASKKGWFVADHINRLAVDLTEYWQGGQVKVHWMDYDFEPLAHTSRWIIQLALDQWTNRYSDWRDSTELKKG